MKKIDNILHLNLKRKWFDMILSGEKKEEYREIKPYWVVRFTDKYFNTILFSNGYSKNRNKFEIELLNINIGIGKKVWGAKEHEPCYILSLGNIIK